MNSVNVDPGLLAAVAAPRRQAILHLVWRDEHTAGAIHAEMPEITFSAVSQHLRALSDAGLVERRADGRHRYYRANRQTLAPIAPMLEAMWDDALWRLKIAAELEHARRGPRRARRRPTPRARKATAR